MAAVCYFSSFLRSSQKLLAFRLSLKPEEQQQQQQQQQLRWGKHRFSPRKDIISASSSMNPRVSRKVRAGRSVKSNAELCNDLREFVSMVGLPEGHVPSLKELSQHGRKDLVNIVRRRGYKLITELLMNSTKGDTNTETSSAENQDDSNICKNEPIGQDQKVNKLAEDLSLSSESSIVENSFSSANGVLPLLSGTQGCESRSATSSSLQEKAAKFIQDGELDMIEDEDVQLHNSSDVGYVISSISGVDEAERCTELDNEIEVESRPPSEESLIHEATGSNAASMANASALTSKLVAPRATEPNAPRVYFSSAEGLNDTHSREDLDVEASERGNQVEINRLKVMLHQKELELSQLKEQIEKEKLALSSLQAKAEKEIDKAQKIILLKDEELHAAEEGLSGLKEVQIEYWGNGETVEVAGSFNGWHHQIKMDPHLASSTINPSGSRKSRLWSTVLWLYPGIYEIKFIVDGHWKIDPQKESVIRGTIQNNILRVGR